MMITNAIKIIEKVLKFKDDNNFLEIVKNMTTSNYYTLLMKQYGGQISSFNHSNLIELIEEGKKRDVQFLLEYLREDLLEELDLVHSQF